MTSQQSNTKDKDMDGMQQRKSRWNKEALITSIPWAIGPVWAWHELLKNERVCWPYCFYSKTNPY
ncbi:hypothetical protein M153_4240004543 [Pseudoloma neurophilia]|uniref:Uncharacterized protein n=1 Tax=Pseudoloma neurophilia TaxID=146866 RepID=A0A0R0LXF8_9MICR|nr:hypothetical protein M153_4240004543 [Pseudoloma neurophilia]